MLRVLINRYYGGLSEELRPALPKKFTKELKRCDVRSDDASRALAQPADRLKRVHYSWLKGYLEKMPEELRMPTIASLPREQARGICRILGCAVPKRQPSPPMAQYLLQHLYSQINQGERLPARYLPHSYLNRLGDYSKEELVRLASLLGLRDLVAEMRHIVKKTNQEALLRCLDDEERQFFNFYMYKERVKLSVPRLQLEHWDGNCRNLKLKLQRRGLGRLGKALSGQDKTLLWYIEHALDTGRAKIVTNNCEKDPIPNVTPQLLRQVVGIMNYFEKQS